MTDPRVCPHSYLTSARGAPVTAPYPHLLGRNVVRKGGLVRAAGLARYVDDLALPGLLHARTIRSTVPAGTITGMEFAFDTTGFTVVTADDIRDRNTVALIMDDQPCLADGVVR